MAETKQPLNAQMIHAGDSTQDAVSLGHEIYMSRDISNAYRVLTPEGDVLVNTGIVFHAEENFRRLSAVSSNSVKKVVFTQSHDDHIGGWRWFNTPETETIAQANFAHVRRYWRVILRQAGRCRRFIWRKSLSQQIQTAPAPCG